MSPTDCGATPSRVRPTRGSRSSRATTANATAHAHCSARSTQLLAEPHPSSPVLGGDLRFAADAVVHALRDAVGPDGTLLVACGDDSPYHVAGWPDRWR